MTSYFRDGGNEKVCFWWVETTVLFFPFVD